MKLSHKLLALSGVALADYACCPYDDYGIPFGDCVAALPEKTPFSDQPDWNTGACKSWEFNPDASFDGNDGASTCGTNENWGSCGFQRHFPWSSSEQAAYLGTSGYTGDFGSANLAIGGAANQFSVGGAPFLGGVCKLFIPVETGDIESVSVAGVHLNPHFTNKAFDAAFGGVDGSLHCFSVVNPSEGLRSGDIHNGNVAGGATPDNTGGEPLEGDHFDGDTSLDRQDGQEVPFQWVGPQTTMGSDAGPGATGDSAVGQNFDVVVHFKESACRTHWQREDMQLAGDWGDNSALTSQDYPYGVGGLMEHDHADSVEKRFAAVVAYNSVFAVNGDYLEEGSDSGRWPNYGAFAAFYSFVTCANTDASSTYNNNPNKYVFADFHHHADCDPFDGIGDGATETSACLAARTIVPALGTNDYRTPDCTGGTNTLSYRSNVRQAGTAVTNCGPGEILDSDEMRCTWNWNFHDSGAHDTGFGTDPEDFFQRSESFNFIVWNDGEVARANGHNGKVSTLATPIKDVQISLAFKDTLGADICATTSVLTFDVPAKYMSGGNTVNMGGGCPVAAEFFPDGGSSDHNDLSYVSFDKTLTCASSDQDDRDNFPDCYQGDEIHFELSYVAASADTNRLDPWRTVAKLTQL